MTDMTPEERAASTDYTENLSLLKYCTGVSPFHEAAARCDVLALRRCMATYGFTRYPKYVGIHSKSAVLTCAGDTPLDIAIQWNARAAVAILLRAGAGRTPFINEHVLDKVLPHQATAALHVRKVIDGGGFKKYEQDHLATLTKTFEPKFTMLPKELVRHVVSFWLHAGYY